MPRLVRHSSSATCRSITSAFHTSSGKSARLPPSIANEDSQNSGWRDVKQCSVHQGHGLSMPRGWMDSIRGIFNNNTSTTTTTNVNEAALRSGQVVDLIRCRGPSTAEVRREFINFFKSEAGGNAAEVAPSSVFPKRNEGSYFINADELLGVANDSSGDNRFWSLTKAVNSQPCIRVGGRHNDLNNVGFDSSHLTMFEMLGNWQFGKAFDKISGQEVQGRLPINGTSENPLINQKPSFAPGNVKELRSNRPTSAINCPTTDSCGISS